MMQQKPPILPPLKVVTPMTKALVETFMSKEKAFKKEEEYLEILMELEKAIYKDAETEVNSTLIKELQKPPTLESALKIPSIQLTFLNTTLGVDEHYMNAQIHFERQMKSNAKQIDHVSQQEKLQKDQDLLSFPLYDRNFLDINANSKFYHPEKHDYGLHEISRQFADQSNAQRLLIKDIDHYAFEQPEQKYLYPRGLIENTIKANPLPDFIAKKEKDFKFKPAIDALGGYRDTIDPMIPSLKINEQRQFLNTPLHSMAQIARDPMKKPIVKPVPEYVELPDPFTRNPQYQMRNLKTTNYQSQDNVGSYLPTNQPRNNQSEMVYNVSEQQNPNTINQQNYRQDIPTQAYQRQDLIQANQNYQQDQPNQAYQRQELSQTSQNYQQEQLNQAYQRLDLSQASQNYNQDIPTQVFQRLDLYESQHFHQDQQSQAYQRQDQPTIGNYNFQQETPTQGHYGQDFYQVSKGHYGQDMTQGSHNFQQDTQTQGYYGQTNNQTYQQEEKEQIAPSFLQSQRQLRQQYNTKI